MSRRWLMLLAAMTLGRDVLATPAAGVDVIPAPAHVEMRSGAFTIRDGVRILIPRDARAARVARYFVDLLRETRGIQVQLSQDAGSKSAAIEFKLTPRSAGTGPESYTVDIAPQRVQLDASDERGLLYAAVTLWQLCTSAGQPSQQASLQAVHIADQPRFGWRGILIDSARHYQSPEFILQFLDWMALHKLNVLHWHLTDDQAWRLEIKKYPRLTQIGAWRVPEGAAAATDIDPATHRPRLYGGFYSQDDVRRIVTRATARNITIVPEIDMPGHASAAIVAYPRLGTVQPAPSAVSSDWGVYDNLYNAEPTTFEFLEDVLGEVIELFPGRYVHVGGDEAVKKQWQASPRIQQRMRELGVPNEAALQGYFIARMGKFLARHGRRAIGWDEILEGDIPADAAIMSWRGVEGAATAAAAGHDTVLSPAPTLYFDNRQGNLPDEPPGRGLIIRAADVYRFDPLPATLPAESRRHVLGLQGNIWTEHIQTQERLEEMAFPRAAALAEVAWSAPDTLSWEGFVGRLRSEMIRYRELGIHASNDVFAVDIDAGIDASQSQARIQLSNQGNAGQIHYTLDGSEPTTHSIAYSVPFLTPAQGQLRAAAFDAGSALGPPTARDLDVAALYTRSSRDLQSCPNGTLLYLEDDAPLHGRRALFMVNIMNACWTYPAVDLTHVGAVAASVGQLPFNFQLGDAARSIELTAPQTPSGELQVRLDSCAGPLIAQLSLQPALGNATVTDLPAVPLRQSGVHDLCFRFTQKAIDPLWVIDRVSLRPSS